MDDAPVDGAGEDRTEEWESDDESGRRRRERNDTAGCAVRRKMVVDARTTMNDKRALRRRNTDRAPWTKEEWPRCPKCGTQYPAKDLESIERLLDQARQNGKRMPGIEATCSRCGVESRIELPGRWSETAGGDPGPEAP
jgi:hypothetical protein